MARIANPYPENFRHQKTIKANFHTHSQWSDGRLSLDEIISLYSGLGYKAIMMSDHDVFGGFQGTDAKGMTLIPGVEISRNGPHMLQMGTGKKIDPAQDRQRVINAISSAGGQAIMNHPKWEPWLNHCPPDVLMGLHGYLGMEIINGKCYRDAGAAEATDFWDMVLSSGKKIWGMGNDDFHFVHDAGKCWNSVMTDDMSAKGIMRAVKRGSFYVSTGIEIDDICLKDRAIVIRCRDADLIVAVGENGTELAYSHAGSLTFDTENFSMPYVRFECYGRGRKRAFTQPFFNKDSLSFKPVPETAASRFSGEKQQWREKTATITKMISVKKQKTDRRASRFFIAYDRTRIYFKALCLEPSTTKLETGRTHALYADDSIEFFLDPGRTKKDYYQIVVNAAGRYEVLKNTDHTPCTLRGLSVHAAIAPDRYEIVLSVPFKSIHAPYPHTRPWGLNIIRNRTGAMHDSFTWSWTGPCNHIPSRFGILHFA